MAGVMSESDRRHHLNAIFETIWKNLLVVMRLTRSAGCCKYWAAIRTNWSARPAFAQSGSGLSRGVDSAPGASTTTATSIKDSDIGPISIINPADDFEEGSEFGGDSMATASFAICD